MKTKHFIFAIGFSLAILGLMPLAAVAATQPNSETHSSTTQTQDLDKEIMTPSESAEIHNESKQEDVGVVGLFGLNWKLFIAQLVNFAIVLFVLWKWVFKPVIAGMESRTKKIEDSLTDATRIESEKSEFESWRAKSLSEARQEATSIITEAKKTAESTKQEILNKTKTEQEDIISKAQVQLEQEKQKIIDEAKGQIADLIVNSTEKLIRAKLDNKADAKIIKNSLGDLGE